MTTWKLIIASLKMFVRNKQSLFFTLFMPFIFIGIFGLIGFDKTPVIDVGVATSSPSTTTKAFVDSLGKVSAFKIHAGSETSERAALQKGDRDVVIVVPDNLMPDPTAKTAPSTQKLVVLENLAKAQQAATAVSIMQQILDQTTLQIAKAPNLFTLDVQQINSKNVKYIDFLVPGIVAMSIMQMAIFSVAFVFTEYKEKGILKRLLATPMRPIQFVTAQVVTRLIVAVVQASILLLVGMVVFHTHMYGSWFLMYLLVFIGAIIFLGLGFTISGIAKTVDAVPAIANIFAFPMMFLSGIFFPTSTMPTWLQHIVVYLPLQPFATALRSVVADGAGFSAIHSEFYWMLGWAVVLSALAVFTFSLEEKRI